MAKVRCQETAAESFFGNFLYDQKGITGAFFKEAQRCCGLGVVHQETAGAL
jgi:hypothetical protein